METPNRPVSPSVDLGGRLRRTANVQDHVPRFLVRRIDANRHSSPRFLLDCGQDLSEALATALHHDCRESSLAQRSAQMGAGVVQTVHLAVHLEQGKSPPTYLHTFRTSLGDVLFRRQPNSHEIAYSPRLEKGAPRR